MTSDSIPHFNQIAEVWARVAGLDPSVRDAALDAACIPAGGAVLDAGCGSGLLLPALLSRIGSGGRIVALDGARRMLAIAARQTPDPRIRYVCLDLSDYDGGDGPFDTAVCCRLLLHLHDPATALARMAGWLRPDGRLVVFHEGERDEETAAQAASLQDGGFQVCSAFQAYGLSAWVCRKAGHQARPDAR